MDDITIALVISLGAVLGPATAYVLYVGFQLIREELNR